MLNGLLSDRRKLRAGNERRGKCFDKRSGKCYNSAASHRRERRGGNRRLAPIGGVENWTRIVILGLKIGFEAGQTPGERDAGIKPATFFLQ